MTKRFILFVGEQYYPRGGWLDFHGEFDSIEEAQSNVDNHPQFRYLPEDTWECDIDWAHILDTTTNKIVWRFYERFNESTRRCEMVWGE
jgi:hypothetical protein